MGYAKTDVYGNPIDPFTGKVTPREELARATPARVRWFGLIRQIIGCSLMLGTMNSIGNHFIADMPWRQSLLGGGELAFGVAMGMVLCIKELAIGARCRRELQEWVGQEGHERCWYYPDLFRRLCRILGVNDEPVARVTREEFAEGCLRFQREEFGPPDHATGGDLKPVCEHKWIRKGDLRLFVCADCGASRE